MDEVFALLNNYILSAAVLSWITAQIIKTILTLITTKRFDFERLVGAGGMPSAHSALVCSMTFAISRKEGCGSPLFALSLMFAAVVMYDAMGVRRAAGEQAKVINKIVVSIKRPEEKGADEIECSSKKRLKKDKNKFVRIDDMQFKKLKEYLGHTPLEVLGGALLGIIMALIIPMR